MIILLHFLFKKSVIECRYHININILIRVSVVKNFNVWFDGKY